MKKLELLFLLVIASLQLQSMDQPSAGIDFSRFLKLRSQNEEEQTARIAWNSLVESALTKGGNHSDTELLKNVFLQANTALYNKEVQQNNQRITLLPSLIRVRCPLCGKIPTQPATASAAALTDASVAIVPQVATTTIEVVAASMAAVPMTTDQGSQEAVITRRGFEGIKQEFLNSKK